MRFTNPANLIAATIKTYVHSIDRLFVVEWQTSLLHGGARRWGQ